MIDTLNTASKQVGLEMNLRKTMVTTNSIQKRITVDNENLNYTENYIYLGKQIGFNRKQNELEVDRRVRITWNKYWPLKWTSRVTKWMGPIGKRLKGRPYLRWTDELIKIAGTCWSQTGQDRNMWNSLEETFTLT
nr:uncharacterized protein LOC116775098 [Danaus plexippus plexippus]